MRRARPASLLVLTLLVGGCATGQVRTVTDQGRVTVGVTTTGSSSPATFRLTIEPAGIAGDIKADAGVFVNDHVPAGDHVVRLLLPAHCRVDGGPDRKITISQQRRSAVLRFDVRCS